MAGGAGDQVASPDLEYDRRSWLMRTTCRRPIRGFRSSGSTTPRTSTAGILPRSSVPLASRRTPGVSTARCTPAACGRCASTRASATPRRPTSASSSCSTPARPGLSCAFDLPTQMGYDSDAGRAEGEVGKVGVAIDSMEDMRLLLADLPLDQVSTSMTINSTAAILLLMYELVAEENGVSSDQISGTIQNDLLKEYIAAWYLRVSASSVDADHHRHLRVLQQARPELEHDLDLRLPHPRGRLDGRAGDRVHARQRDCVRPGGDRRRARRRRFRAAAVASSGTGTTTSSKRSPSSVPAAACGTRS